MAIRTSSRPFGGRIFIALAALGVVALPLLASDAFAQQSQEERAREDRRRSSQTLSERSGRALNDALNAANEEPPRINDAIGILTELLGRNLPAYDRATALEIRGQLYFQNDNIEGAIRDFNEALQLDVLPSEREKNLVRGIAQLYYLSERFTDAIRFMEEFVREFPQEAEANDYFIIAGAYAQNDNFRGARGPAERALQLHKASGAEPNEQFYSILNLIYSELGLSAERLRLLEDMVGLFPSNSSYWGQLAGLYSEQGRNADALAVLEVSYKAGLITDENRIVTLAQFYYDQDNPYRGARLLESEMQAGNVNRDLDNLELLAQLWAAAREQDKAIEILTEAAPRREDGGLYYQLGQSYLADERYELAIRNLRAAISRGGLSDREIGNARVLIGTALFQQDSESKEARQAAREEFVRAARVETSARTANDWITYIDTIEETLERQAAVEFSQAVERKTREIERCSSILDVIELGGRTEVPAEQIEACRALLQRVEEEEVTPEMLVREEMGETEAEGSGEGAEPAEGEAG